MNKETSFMRRALRLAERGRGRVSPNPAVGAVVVQDGDVVGEGWHRGPGAPHAEIEALQAAGGRARGSTLYLTLEPCTHEGRTPPCAPAVIASGIARAVIATEDPNPQERGAGIAALRAAGVAVEVGLLEDDARALIAGFARWIVERRPFVTLKLAMSIDGRVAAADGSSRWITGEAARLDAHRERARADAVLVGVGTVLADDPALTCRVRGYKGPQPLRVVLDSSARTPRDASLLSDEAPTLIATSAKATEEAAEELRARGADVVRFPTRDGRVDIAAVLDELGRRDVCELLAEGGPAVAGELVELRAVDRYVFYVAPKVIGQVGLAAIAGVIAPSITDARALEITSVRRIGNDIKIEAKAGD
ncbi:MAG: bifunctional diaminohydroxyphosphoribosylaminopyrimidine deaminase/5-amino-6-(5-phosphoribosylamino)uracil reductase RibD [Actinomycetota bacterium]